MEVTLCANSNPIESEKQMARKGMTGQLNMFDFFRSLEEIPLGEVEMVSLVPSDEEEEEPKVEKEPEVEEVESDVEVKKSMVKEKSQVAMSRSYQIDGKTVEIAYINYNKVRITKNGESPIIKEFASTKEAVDYYVEQMQELEVDE